MESKTRLVDPHHRRVFSFLYRGHVDPRPAASAVIVRDTPDGIETLMVERPGRGYFGGLHVFPGGAVDDADSSEVARALVPGDEPDRSHRCAALRETAEEIGWVLTEEGVVPAPDLRGIDLLHALAGSRLAGERMALISRWVTPIDAPVRFDTWFYLVPVGEVPPVRLAGDELVSHMWVRPAAALEMGESGSLSLILPTATHLRWLSRSHDVAGALASASGADGRSLIEPTRMEDGSLVPVHLPA